MNPKISGRLDRVGRREGEPEREFKQRRAVLYADFEHRRGALPPLLYAANPAPLLQFQAG